MRFRYHRFEWGIWILLAVAWVAFLLFAWKLWFAAPKKVVASPVEQKTITSLSSNKITVYVIGAVKHPGLYRLPLDARINSAIRIAGGATATADLLAVNLAAVAEDGTEIVVPEKSGESPTPVKISSGTSSKGIPPGVRIPINKANVTTLDSLPGIGIKKAQAIVDYRRAHGLFTSVNQLSQVKGIGPRLLAKIIPYVSLH